jgi:uncharacterized protein (DUF58 family)
MNCIRRAVLRQPFLSKERTSGELRAYEPGEEARAIDWHASARKGSLHIRKRDAHLTLTWGAIADISLSMSAGRGRSLSEAAQEAADFWRGCATPGDRWIDIDPGGQHGLFHGLDRAFRVLPAHSALLAAGDFFDLPEVPDALIRAVARRLDCSALVARDPWRDNLPLGGFVAVADLETGDVRRLFIGARERMRFQCAARAREDAILARLRQAGWRAATFSEECGRRAVLRAFGAA